MNATNISRTPSARRQAAPVHADRGASAAQPVAGVRPGRPPVAASCSSACSGRMRSMTPGDLRCRRRAVRADSPAGDRSRARRAAAPSADPRRPRPPSAGPGCARARWCCARSSRRSARRPAARRSSCRSSAHGPRGAAGTPATSSRCRSRRSTAATPSAPSRCRISALRTGSVISRLSVTSRMSRCGAMSYFVSSSSTVSGRRQIAEMTRRQVDRRAEHQPVGLPAGELREGLLHDPPGDPLDQRGALGERDEDVRGEIAELGVIPAHQALDGRHGAGVQVELRLVVDGDLGVVRVLQGSPQIRLQPEAGDRVGVALRVVERVGAAGGFGAVERDVGAAQQPLDRVAVLGRERDADAAVHIDPDAARLGRSGAAPRRCARPEPRRPRVRRWTGRAPRTRHRRAGPPGRTRARSTGAGGRPRPAARHPPRGRACR